MATKTNPNLSAIIAAVVALGGSGALQLMPDRDDRVDSSWEDYTRPALIRAAERMDEMQEEIVQLRIADAKFLAEREALVRELLDVGAVDDEPVAKPVRVKRKPKRARVGLPARLVE